MAIERYEGQGKEDAKLMRQAAQGLNQLRVSTVYRAAWVQGETMVQHEKLRSIDHLAREAMTGQALLIQWAAAVSNGDPVINDEVNFYVGLARMAKAQIIADTVDTFCRESGGHR